MFPLAHMRCMSTCVKKCVHILFRVFCVCIYPIGLCDVSVVLDTEWSWSDFSRPTNSMDSIDIKVKPNTWYMKWGQKLKHKYIFFAPIDIYLLKYLIFMEIKAIQCYKGH